MRLVRSGVRFRPFLHDGRALLSRVEVHSPVSESQTQYAAVEVNFRLARIRKHKKLVAVLSADRSGVCAHRYSLETHSLVGSKIAHQMPVVSVDRRVLVHIEVVAVLHKEFTSSHDAEARADFISELPLDMEHSKWELPV